MSEVIFVNVVVSGSSPTNRFASARTSADCSQGNFIASAQRSCLALAHKLSFTRGRALHEDKHLHIAHTFHRHGCDEEA